MKLLAVMLCEMLYEVVGSNTLVIKHIHGDVLPANQVKLLNDLLHAIIRDAPRCQRDSD